MKKIFLFPILFVFFFGLSCQAEEHLIERGETCLQIAIDHDLTMAQLQQLNPGVDLEMMMIGETLILPDEGVSFDEFLAAQYARYLQISEEACSIAADGSALCFFYAENISEVPLFEVRYRVSVRGQNGFSGSAEADVPLMEILPGERLPLAVNVPGGFDAVENIEISVLNLTRSEHLQSSFRISDSCFLQKFRYSPDHVSASAGIEFVPECINSLREKHINVYAAAFDENEKLVGVRSLYTDFYPQLEITAYSNNEWIETLELRLEAY